MINHNYETISFIYLTRQGIEPLTFKFLFILSLPLIQMSRYYYTSTDGIKGSAANVLMWRHVIQHNDTQHNDIQHNTLNVTIIKGDTKHKRDSA
jgi:hypothetical protein